MTTLVLADYLRDLATPAPAALDAVELRVKWVMNAYREWERWLVWRDGNAEHFIRSVPEIDLTTPDRANAKDKP